MSDYTSLSREQTRRLNRGELPEPDERRYEIKRAIINGILSLAALAGITYLALRAAEKDQKPQAYEQKMLEQKPHSRERVKKLDDIKNEEQAVLIVE